MPFFYSESLVSLSMKTGLEPWDFKPTEKITLQIRKSKQDRQEWYQNPATRHYFYSGIEGVNPNQRISKDNPPHKEYYIIADFDVPIPDARVNEIVASMPIKPMYIERSLGGNIRLIWKLVVPFSYPSKEFFIFLKRRLVTWLNLHLGPGLDEPALSELTRLYCCGDEWRGTGAGPIPEAKAQAFLVETVKAYNFKGPEDGVTIPLDEIEKALREKYPNFDWPVDFSLESQGPSFWIPESTSPMSAIVKDHGIYTFSAHAEKSFYTWADLLGAVFVKDRNENAIARATTNIYFDSHCFFRDFGPGLGYQPSKKDELETYFKTRCGLSSKPGKAGGDSQIDQAKQFICDYNRIVGAVPVMMQKPGLLILNNDRVLNTYGKKPVEPAEGKFSWCAEDLPFIFPLWTHLFKPGEQLDHFLAWVKRGYEAAYNWAPCPHAYTILQGGVGIGKTLSLREIVGMLIGGYVDASQYLVKGGAFNGHLLRYPFWSLDDDTAGSHGNHHDEFLASLKKLVAQGGMMFNEKFQKGAYTEFYGMIGISVNMDFVSARLIGSMENGVMDKCNLFRCATDLEDLGWDMPSREFITEALKIELPRLGRILLDWKVPAHIKPHSRYGYEAYQEKAMLCQVRQTSNAAPFKELLWAALENYFNENPDRTFWEGNSRKLQHTLIMDPGNDAAMKRFDVRQINRYMDDVSRSGALNLTISNGPMDTRVWRVNREDIIKNECSKPN